MGLVFGVFLAVELVDCWLYICFIGIRNDCAMSSKYARKQDANNNAPSAGIKLSSKALDQAETSVVHISEVVLPCADKLAFDAKKPADIAAMVAAYQHGTKLKSYMCSHCALWHLASA
jgi:hypothetical protein